MISPWHTNHITHQTYRVTIIKQTILERRRDVGNPLISSLLTGSYSHDDNALWFCKSKSLRMRNTDSNEKHTCLTSECRENRVPFAKYRVENSATDTVYPKKYAHGFCFAVLCCGYTLTDFPISIRLTSLALCQSNDCPSASKVTLMNMDKYFMWIHYERLHNHNKAKHNKTVCIFLGIYCMRSLKTIHAAMHHYKNIMHKNDIYIYNKIYWF